MLRKLRLKFICINMVIVTVMLCVLFSVLLTSTSRAIEGDSIKLMEGIASAPMTLDEMDALPDDSRTPYFVLETDSQGEMLKAGNSMFALQDDEWVNQVWDAAEAFGTTTGILNAYNLRFYSTAREDGIRVVFTDTTRENALLAGLRTRSMWIGVAAFMVFLAISALLARWAVKPVDQAWRQQRQFIADASHELKTPLTVIMTNAELLQDDDYDESDQRQFSKSILTMSQQMRGLVDRLLEMARADDGRMDADFARINLSQLVTDIVLPFEPVFFEKGLTLSRQIESDIHVTGSAEYLKQLVDILLDNAQKYASVNGNAALTLNRRGRCCLLTVENTGEAINKADLKNIFKRFYRVDRSRHMNQSYGLGLSIAQGIVIRHHGRIWASSSMGINCFHVELPLA